MELETASFQAGRLADFAGLIALAAEGLEADGDTINAPKFYAAADALRESLDKLKMEIFVLSEVWLRERIAASS
jgi:hypothetical protein